MQALQDYQRSQGAQITSDHSITSRNDAQAIAAAHQAVALCDRSQWEGWRLGGDCGYLEPIEMPKQRPNQNESWCFNS